MGGPWDDASLSRMSHDLEREMDRGSFNNPVAEQQRTAIYQARMAAVAMKLGRFVDAETQAGLQLGERMGLRNAARQAAYEELTVGVDGKPPPTHEPHPLQQCQLEELFLEKLEDLFVGAGMPGFNPPPVEEGDPDTAVKVRKKKTPRYVEGAEVARTRPIPTQDP
jgi:hypothetical protein